MGVGLDSFWELTPRLFKYVGEGYRMRQRTRETELYIMGRYMMDAVSLALSNGFRKKGTQAQGWLEEPYRIVPFSEEELAERAEKDRASAVAFFDAWANSAAENGEEVNENA